MDGHDLLSEVANDIKWLKKSVEENASATTRQYNAIIQRLESINGCVANHSKRIALSRWMIGGAYSILAIIITVLLHLLGVY